MSESTENPSGLVRMSSNWTIFLKLFIPVFWLSFFIPASFAILFSESFYQLRGSNLMSLIILGVLLSGLLFFYLTTWKLHRIDATPDELYASNYFKTIKFPFENIERVSENNLLITHLFCLHLKQKGHLGKKIYFIESGRSFREFVERYPEKFQGYSD